MKANPEREFYLAALPEPVVLLGQRLNPLSIGHLTLLQRFECAFVTPDKKATLDDLAFAVFICAQTWEEGTASLLDDDLPKKLRQWGKFVAKFRFEEKAGAFQDYLVAGSRGPRLGPCEDSGRLPGAPFLQRVRMILHGKLNYSLSESMNCPWGLALWEYFAFFEMEGAVKLYSAEDAAQHEAALRLREQVVKEGGWMLFPMGGRN